jgi:hypothetical protein
VPIHAADPVIEVIDGDQENIGGRWEGGFSQFFADYKRAK